MRAVLDIYAVWNRRIPTGALNRWFGDMLEQHPPPLVDGRRLKLRYLTQIKRRPPTFLLFTTRPAQLPESYRSEEHTSELQSLMRISYAVFCLKKKKTQT